ncbi:MAG: glycosyltransferase family 4 protein [Candidatus Zophobacter franzmannii]|nr:glycosyltransferase family 4 protein [Candidatus Zophobacter franzmannii]
MVTSDAKRTELVKKYCLPENAKFASIIGRVTPIKNHDMFLDIAKKLITKHDDLYFLVVGDGDLFEEVKTKISARKLGDKIIMTGMIQDMSTIYSLTDIVLLTSKNEGTPVALIEAMSQSKLVFSTNVGGVSDFIKQGINGFYFEQSDVDGFVSEISNWVTNPHNYDNIREEARTTAVNTFSSTRLVSDIENLYSRCLKK